MNEIIKWAVAPALVLVAGCGTTQGGTTSTSAAGETGTSGAGGTQTGGMSGSGGSSGTAGGATEMSACETCAYAKCKTEVAKCEADKGPDNGYGCVEKLDEFYDCLKTADTDDKIMGCETSFVSQVFGMGIGRALASDVTGCVDNTDPAKGCLAECAAR